MQGLRAGRLSSNAAQLCTEIGALTSKLVSAFLTVETFVHGLAAADRCRAPTAQAPF